MKEQTHWLNKAPLYWVQQPVGTPLEKAYNGVTAHFKELSKDAWRDCGVDVLKPYGMIPGGKWDKNYSPSVGETAQNYDGIGHRTWKHEERSTQNLENQEAKLCKML